MKVPPPGSNDTLNCNLEKSGERRVSISFRVLALVALVFCANSSDAQQPRGEPKIRIHVLDGRTGKIIADDHLLIFVTNSSQQPEAVHIDRTTDSAGLAILDEEAASFRYIQVWTDWHILCVKCPNCVEYPISEVLNKGLVSQNLCGTVKVQPKPGDLYIFARRRHWWESTNFSAPRQHSTRQKKGPNLGF